MTSGDISRRGLLATIGTAAGGVGLFARQSSATLVDQETLSGRMRAGSIDLKVGYEAAAVEGMVDPHAASETTWLAADPTDDTRMLTPPYDDPCSQLPDPDTMPSPLFEVADIVPGDGGRALFDLHVCGNDGYVWTTADITNSAENSLEPAEKDRSDDATTGELPDVLQARVWYDVKCDGEYTAEEDTLIAEGTLQRVLDDLGAGIALTPNPGTAVLQGSKLDDTNLSHTDGETYDMRLPTDDSVSVTLSDFVYKDGGGSTAVATDGGTHPPSTDENSGKNDEKDKNSGKNGEKDKNSGKNDPKKDENTGKNDSSKDKKDENTGKNDEGGHRRGELVQFDFHVEEAEWGVCRVEVKAGKPLEGSATGNEPTSVVSFADCPRDGTVTSTPRPVEEGGYYGFSHVVFYFSRQGEGDCFAACTDDQCIGFEWWLPMDASPIAQTDSVAFDLGFAAEQCRHNGVVGQ